MKYNWGPIGGVRRGPSRALKNRIFLFCQMCITNFSPASPLLTIWQEPRKDLARNQSAIYKCHWAKAFDNDNVWNTTVAFTTSSLHLTLVLVNLNGISEHFSSSAPSVQWKTSNGDDWPNSAICVLKNENSKLPCRCASSAAFIDFHKNLLLCSVQCTVCTPSYTLRAELSASLSSFCVMPWEIFLL